jgi:hypothetical protein
VEEAADIAAVAAVAVAAGVAVAAAAGVDEISSVRKHK